MVISLAHCPLVWLMSTPPYCFLQQEAGHFTRLRLSKRLRPGGSESARPVMTASGIFVWILTRARKCLVCSPATAIWLWEGRSRRVLQQSSSSIPHDSLVLATAHSQPPSVETMKGRQYISRYITDLTINYLSISKYNQSVEKLDLARPLLNWTYRRRDYADAG